MRLAWFISVAATTWLAACSRGGSPGSEAAPSSSPAAAAAPAETTAAATAAEPPPAPTPAPKPAEAVVSSSVDIHQQCDRCVKGSCALSDADACYHLALKYEAGDEVPQDTNRARALLQKASEAGHAKARQRFRQKWGL